MKLRTSRSISLHRPTVNPGSEPPSWSPPVCPFSRGVSLSCGHPETYGDRISKTAQSRSPPVSTEDSDPPLPYNPGQRRPNSTASPPRTRAGNPYGPPAPRRAPADTTTPAILPSRGAPPQGHRTDGPFMVHVPFSASDLYNWKAQNPPFPEKPQALMGLLESVFRTHRPTWDDCQQLLVSLFTAEERGRIRAQAPKIAAGGRRAEEAGEQTEEEFPSTRPDRGHNSQAGRTALDRCHRILIGGIRVAARQPTNFSKVTEVTQGPQESPGVFLERLQEAYRVYTPTIPRPPRTSGQLM